MALSTDARPIFFGDGHQLFGWYHPAQGPTRECAIVLCPPIGHEYVCSHRAFRHLAERLAATGFAVLRFDYYGTGDSAGGPRDDTLVQRWRDNVALAIHEVRVQSGLQRVALLGLRIGATLAALTAVQRNDVETLVLWSPCVTGKAYVREVTMLGRMTATQAAGAAPEDGSIEAAGFMVSRATATDLSTLKLIPLAPALASGVISHVLLLSRDDFPSEDALAHDFQQRGSAVTQTPFSGYDTFMVAPVQSTLPTGALDSIVQWFETTYSGATTASHASPPLFAPPLHSPARTGRPTRTLTSAGDAVREEAMRFGAGLFGILTEPIIPDPRKPGVLLLNTGGDPHIGPHRMYTPLARTWAAMGFPVFRFDIAGLGDSPAPSGQSEGIAYPPNAIDDIRAAVAHVRAVRGIERIVVAGICSGAYYAIHAVHEGVPVIGNIAVNPPLYWRPGLSLDEDPYWNRYEIHRVGRALFSPAKWGRLVHGKVDFKYTLMLLVDRLKILSLDVMIGALERITQSAGDPPREDIATLFPETVDTTLIFSQGDPGLIYLERQIDRKLAALYARPHFSLDIIPGADHTFMPLRWQHRLTGLLTERLVERYGQGG